jgi:CHAD domain-containing protein
MTIEQLSISFPSMRDFALFRLNGNLDSIHAEINGVVENTDIEFIHRIRIAIRRYRNNLRIFRYFSDQNFYNFLEQKYQETAEFSTLLGFARDLDIQYYLIDVCLDLPITPVKDEILNEVKDKRTVIQNQLAEYINSPAYSLFLEHGDQIQTVFSNITTFAGAEAILNAAKSSLAFSLSVLYPITPNTNGEEVHRFRKAIRRVRYTLESIQPVVAFPIDNEIEISHKIQDLLGDMHDLDMVNASITLLDDIPLDEKNGILENIYKKHQDFHVQFIEKINSNEMIQILLQMMDLFS